MSDSNPEREKSGYDDVNTGALFLVGLISVVLVTVAIFAVQTVYFRYEESEFQRKIVNSAPSEAERVIAAQKELIATSHPLPQAETADGGTDSEAQQGADSEAGENAEPKTEEMSIPISKAMEMVVAEYQEAQENQTTPVASKP